MSSSHQPRSISANRLITEPPQCPNLASMRGLLRRHPTRIDRTLSALLILLAELEIWLGGGAGSHRIQYAIAAPLMVWGSHIHRRAGYSE